jgi:hypothetical protein
MMATAAFLQSIISVSFSSFSLRSTIKAKFERKTGLLSNSHSTTVNDPCGPSQAGRRSEHADKDTWLVGDPAYGY